MRGQKVGCIVGDARIERRGFCEVREKLRQSARIEHGAGKLVRANFAALLENIDAFGGKLGFGARFIVLPD